MTEEQIQALINAINDATDRQSVELIEAMQWAVHTASAQIVLVLLILYFWNRRRNR